MESYTLELEPDAGPQEPGTTSYHTVGPRGTTLYTNASALNPLIVESFAIEEEPVEEVVLVQEDGYPGVDDVGPNHAVQYLNDDEDDEGDLSDDNVIPSRAITQSWKPVTSRQKCLLVSFIKENRIMLHYPLNDSARLIEYAKKWNEVTELLNKKGIPRTKKNWQLTWRNLKRRALRKMKKRRLAQMGKTVPFETWENLDTEILNLIKTQEDEEAPVNLQEYVINEETTYSHPEDVQMDNIDRASNIEVPASNTVGNEHSDDDEPIIIFHKRSQPGDGNQGKRKTMSSEQKNCLVTFLSKHPQMIHNYKGCVGHWDALATRLNKLGPPLRRDQWIGKWKHVKKYIREKRGVIRAHQKGLLNGTCPELDEFHKQVATLIETSETTQAQCVAEQLHEISEFISIPSKAVQSQRLVEASRQRQKTHHAAASDPERSGGHNYSHEIIVVPEESLNQKRPINADRLMAMSTATPRKYKTLNLSVPKPFVYHVELNRPDQLNSFNKDLWVDIKDCFNELDKNEECRVVLLSAAGRLFTAGLDFNSMMELGQALADHEDVARRCKILSSVIVEFQDSMSSLEKCVKPVLCVIHNACIGAGLNLITAADIRYCTDDAYFSLKEVDIGLAADIGVLQRLPKVIGSASLVNELAFTARKMLAKEAKECGLVNRVYKDKASMIEEALSIAEDIASKSPVAVQGTKRSLVYSRDHSVQEGLNHIAMWNQTMLQSEDFMNASIAQATKGSKPVFAKL